MLLSVIIVNYKTPKLLADCLRSIYDFDSSCLEIIVVDNYSCDGAEQMIKKDFPSVQFLQMNYNAGFARANNAGIKLAKGELILLLNSDTLNLNDAINKAAEMLAASTHEAAGVQLLNKDLSPQISGNFAMKGGLNYLLPLPYTGKFLRSIAFALKLKKPSIDNTSQTIEVDWINGAFLMVKKKVTEKSGLLDEDFFLYAEEAEWCSRIKKHGTLCIFGELNVLHLQGESANDAFGSEGKGYFNLFDKKGLQIMLSNFVRIKKQFGTFWFLFDLIIYMMTIPVFFAGIFLSWIFFAERKPYTFQKAVSYSKNIFSLIKFVPKILSGKPYFYKVL
jgi:GT2 family glycosyltransferase